MGAIFHKLCEKSEQELWDLLKQPEWTKDHAEVAFYMVEIMKAVKKMEHLKKLDEAMEEYDWQEEMMDKKKEKDDDDDKSEFARGGRRGGNRGGGRRRMNYSMFDYDEGEFEGMPMRRMSPVRTPNWETPPIHYGYDYANNGGGSSNMGGNGSSSGNTGAGRSGGTFNVDYAAAQYYENKYRELLEDKWEKEKKDKEKEKDREKEPLMTRMPSPPSK